MYNSYQSRNQNRPILILTSGHTDDEEYTHYTMDLVFNVMQTLNKAKGNCST